MSIPLESRLWAVDMAEKLEYMHSLRSLPESKLKSIARSSETRSFEGGSVEVLSVKAFEIIDALLENLLMGSEPTKKDMAELMAFGLHRNKYGFQEALESNDYALWPHESTTVNCASMMLINYVIAQELNMDPRILEFIGHKTDGDFVDGHTFITVDVGEQRRWAMDQTMTAVGPITWEGNTYTIENILDGKSETTSFVVALQIPEQEYLDRMMYHRSPQGRAAMLLNGQRLGYPKIDGWRAKKVHPTNTYLRFFPDTNEVVSIVSLRRLGMQNRGLEYVMKVEDGKLASESITGYFSRRSGWAELDGKIPIAIIDPKDVSQLTKGLTELSPEQQKEFEMSVMGSVANDEGPFLDVVQQSYHATQQSEDAELVEMISLVEALYQHDLASADKPYIFPMGVLDKQLKKWRDEDGVSAISTNVKKHRYLKTIVRKGLLPPERLETQEVQDLLAISSQKELLEYTLIVNPASVYDGIDRNTFVERRLKDNAHSLEALRAHAATKFDDIGHAALTGYARIFAEFVGHLAYTQDALMLSPQVRKNLVKNVTSYKPL